MQASSRSLVAIPALSAWRRRSRRISSDRPYQEAASGRWRLSSVALILDTDSGSGPRPHVDRYLTRSGAARGRTRS
eukprot:tig00000219_g19515.t2